MGLRMLPVAMLNCFAQPHFAEKSAGRSCTQPSLLGRGLLQGTRFPDLHERPRCLGAIRAVFCSAQSLHPPAPFGVTRSQGHTQPRADSAITPDILSNER